jgi:hypothetical protein
MATPTHPSRTQPPRKARQALSSVAPVASGYERSLRSSLACFSRRLSAIWSGGDR